jgi:site-specific recombinase XerD
MPETLAPSGPTLAAPALLDDYAAYLTAAGYVDRRVRLWGARVFLSRYPQPETWRTAPLAEQCSLHRQAKYFANFLFLTHRLRPTMAYLLVARPKLAYAGRRTLYTDTFARFEDLGRRLGYTHKVLAPTLHFLCGVLAYTGKPVDALTATDLRLCEEEMRACAGTLPPGRAITLRTQSAQLFRVRQLLYHAGILPDWAVRHQPQPARAREVLWRGIPAPIAQVVWRYLDQMATVRAPDTVTNHEGYLRRFFAWLAREHPQVQHLRDLSRPQIEAFKTWLHTTPCASGQPYQRPTIAGTLGILRRFLQTLEEWGWPEAPTRILVFASDRPALDEPLPRFLDDDAAVALLHAARTCGDLFTRVCVETLLRTGLRKGEFVRLQLNSVVQVGGTYWLHVPLGKLHTDRYIPLHPEIKALFDTWLAQRGTAPRSADLFVLHGRRVTVARVDGAIKRAARAAGLGPGVTPHRLRHTLATQAINRGMSLEALAALLGHRSLTMTLVYARIANRTVRDQYLAVSAGLDALYADAVLGTPASRPQPPARDDRSAASGQSERATGPHPVG